MSFRSEVVRIFNELVAAGRKITGLTSATTPLSGSEWVEIVQDGENRKVQSSFLGGGGGSSVNIQSTDTSGASIDLDLDDTFESVLISTDPLSADCTATLSNVPSTGKFLWLFDVTGADSAWGITLAGFVFDDVRWTSVKWVPEADGAYLMEVFVVGSNRIVKSINANPFQT